MDDRPVEDGDPHWKGSVGRPREHRDDTPEALGRDVVVRGQVEELAVVSHDQAMQSAAEPEGVAGDGVEHRLRVVGRGRDQPEDLGAGRLLLARCLRRGRGFVAPLDLLDAAGLAGERSTQPRVVRGKPRPSSPWAAGPCPPPSVASCSAPPPAGVKDALRTSLPYGASMDQFLEWFPGAPRSHAEAVLDHVARSLTEAYT